MTQPAGVAAIKFYSTPGPQPLLLASLKHFLANDFARDQTLKRGGGVAPVSLTVGSAEERYEREPADTTTPSESSKPQAP